MSSTTIPHHTIDLRPAGAVTRTTHARLLLRAKHIARGPAMLARHAAWERKHGLHLQGPAATAKPTP